MINYRIKFNFNRPSLNNVQVAVSIPPEYFMVQIAVDSSLMQDDNLHPNAKAQPIISDFMYSEINKWLNAPK